VDKAILARKARSGFCGPEFFAELSELTGIEHHVVASAFAGERRHVALDAVKVVVAENLDGTPVVWTEKLRDLAKREGMGEYRPGYWEGYELTHEHNEFLRGIGRL
jgi:cyanate lyase